MARSLRRLGLPLAVLVASLGLSSFVAQGGSGSGAGGAAALSSCEANPPQSLTLPITRIAQEESMWCWAAAGEMTMNYVNKVAHPSTTTHISQCEQVTKDLKNKYPGQTFDCCGNRSGICKFTGSQPDYLGYHFKHKETASTDHPSAYLSWNEIRSEIGCKNRPIAFVWSYPGGGGVNGHVLVIVGYEMDGAEKFVIALNPKRNAKAEDEAIDFGDEPEARLRYTYDGYRLGTSSNKHLLDYYAIEAP